MVGLTFSELWSFNRKKLGPAALKAVLAGAWAGISEICELWRLRFKI